MPTQLVFIARKKYINWLLLALQTCHEFLELFPAFHKVSLNHFGSPLHQRNAIK